MYLHPNWQSRWLSVYLMSVLKRLVCIFILEKLIGSAFMNLTSNVAITHCGIAWQGTFIRPSGYWSSYKTCQRVFNICCVVSLGGWINIRALEHVNFWLLSFKCIKNTDPFSSPCNISMHSKDTFFINAA